MSVDDEEPMPEGEEQPPRGVGTMAIVRWMILGAAALLAVGMWLSYGAAKLGSQRSGPNVAVPKYHCPMHPQIVSNEAGECPICHMDLVPMAPNDAGATVSVDASTMPPGTTAITLALDRVQSIGVRTAIVSEAETSGTVRATAIVMAPEQGAAEVHVRTPGFVEAIQIDQTGVHVAAGQSLLSLYSPVLLQAQNELLAIAKWDAGAMSGAARRRLDLLGMSPREIDRVAKNGESVRAIAVGAPREGYITKKNVVLGSYVTPEMTLYEIQDLSRVYVVADVFLRDEPLVAVGAEGRFSAAGARDRASSAKVDLVYPLVNAEARTRRVRMQLKNEALGYAPGEYGFVEFAARKRKALMIPRDALVDTGTARYVFVVESEGRFVPRAVVLGGSEEDRWIVHEGLSAGERVVSGATFLIDSESRLQASVSEMPPTTMTAPAAGNGQGASCDADFDRQKMRDKWMECVKCEKVHRGMGTMEADCKNAIPKPWK